MKYIEDSKDKFISLLVIIDRVMRNPGLEDIPYDVAATVALTTIKQLINPTFLIQETQYIDVEEYRGVLPANYVDIKMVIKVDTDKSETSRENTLINQDPFYPSYLERNYDNSQLSMSKYNIKGEYIYTSFKEGRLHIAYTTIPTDFDGTVMIPDRASVVKAVEFSIMADWLQKKWFAGKITGDKFEWADKQRNWYVGQAGADFCFENLDQRQTLSNILNTLVTNTQHNKYEFKYLGDKELRRLQI